MELEKVVADLMQKVERRFYGKYRGFVVNNMDPKRLGRLTLRVPSVLGRNVVTGWAMPCVPFGGQKNQGFLCIPDIGAGVWVEFEEGDLEFPIWVGTFWSEPGGNSEIPTLNDADGKERKNEQKPPTRKIIKTNKGHTIQFEDADDKEMVTIVEATHKHVVTSEQRRDSDHRRCQRQQNHYGERGNSDWEQWRERAVRAGQSVPGERKEFSNRPKCPHASIIRKYTRNSYEAGRAAINET